MLNTFFDNKRAGLTLVLIIESKIIGLTDAALLFYVQIRLYFLQDFSTVLFRLR